MARICVCMASRARPMAMLGVVMSLWRLRSGKHELAFSIGVDEDDALTLDTMIAPDEGLVVNLWPAPRSPYRGDAENRALDHAREADIAVFAADRTFCITPGWDDVIARGATQTLKRVLWWSSPGDSGCVLPIIPRPWLDAIDFKWSQSIFPFWFDDTWMQQVDLLIHGMPSQKSTASYAGVRAQTTRGREFGFWIDVFIKTFPMRLAQAKQIAAVLGVEWVERPDVMDYITRYNATMLGNVEGFEKTYADPNEPGIEYGAARANAERLLRELSSEPVAA